MDYNKNKSGAIILLTFLLICSSLGIAAFVMSLTKNCKKDNFLDKCTSDYGKIYDFKLFEHKHVKCRPEQRTDCPHFKKYGEHKHVKCIPEQGTNCPHFKKYSEHKDVRHKNE